MGIIAEYAALEKQKPSRLGGPVWLGVYDSGMAEMDADFGGLLREHSRFTKIGEVVHHWRHIGISPIVGVDLAGQGGALADWGISGTANCLGFPGWLVEDTAGDGMHRKGSPKVRLVEGDMVSDRTWDDIGMTLPAPPNLVLFAPAGGMSLLPNDIGFFGGLVSRIVKMANRRHTLVLGQMPEGIKEPLRQLLPQLVYPDWHTAIREQGMPQFYISSE